MENTLENKTKFFALYWGTRCLVDLNNKGEFINYPIEQSNMYRIEESHLELKPVSMISDEDALAVAKIVSPMLFEGKGDKGGHFIDKSEEKSGWISVKHKQKIISVDIDFEGFVFEYHDDESYLRPLLTPGGTDYLRSKGYALPWMALNIEKQIKYGWTKLKID
ncbi:hypothetical protein N6B72_05070 [Chryseobacterium soli]|uniref:hypothetical protein n=1 Tax=Chryseobacterium soli TaxID=445961 RepID=UPI002954AE1F|nr:hypothetical protein [Chryseobacterium soli]MDV7696286.1 hypothetical protein [Chryseobacterium soli]